MTCCQPQLAAGRSRPLRVWPAVAIAIFYLVFSRLASGWVSTNVEIGWVRVGLPLLFVLLLLFWWLLASRAPIRDRVAGAFLFLSAAGVVVYSQASWSFGALLLTQALSAWGVGLALALLATWRLSWRVRRWVMVATLVGLTVFFGVRRVEQMGGNLAPISVWRWQATAVERSAQAPLTSSSFRTARLPEAVGEADWPGFRGAHRDGRVLAPVPDLAAGDFPLRERWRRAVGPAWSSMAAVGDYLFTQEQRGDEELVACYCALTGEQVWVNRVQARFEDRFGLGPRATPFYHEGRLYTQGATGILQALDAATGQTIWRRDLVEELGCRLPFYGFSSSPLVLEGWVIQTSGVSRGLLAFHAGTGELAWATDVRANGYSSPHLAVLDGERQILLASDEGLHGHEPESGKMLWAFPWKIGHYPQCIQPLVFGDRHVMLGATSGAGTRLLRVARDTEGWSVSDVWHARTFRPYFNDGVEQGGFFYGFDGERLVCVDLNTGVKRWTGPRSGGQILLLAQPSLLLVLSEKGRLALVRADPDAYVEVAAFQALEGKTWNHPILAQGRLVVRNADTLMAFDLPTRPTKGQGNAEPNCSGG